MARLHEHQHMPVLVFLSFVFVVSSWLASTVSADAEGPGGTDRYVAAYDGRWLSGSEGGWSYVATPRPPVYAGVPSGGHRTTGEAQAQGAILAGLDASATPFPFDSAFPIYFLLATGLIASIGLWRSRHLVSQNQELEQVARERTAELAKRAAELEVIHTVQQGLVAERDMQAIYNLVGNSIRDLFDAQVVVASIDEAAGLEYIRYHSGRESSSESPRPLGRLGRRLVDVQEPIFIPASLGEAVPATRVEEADLLPDDSVPGPALYVPIVEGAVVHGYVSLLHADRGFAFGEDDAALITTLSNGMSVALGRARLAGENARLLAETEQRNAEVAVINGVQEGLVAQLDMQAIYDLVGDRVRDLFNAQVVVIRTFDHDAGTEHLRYAVEKGQRFYFEPVPADAFTHHLMTLREPVLINEDFAGYIRRLDSSDATAGEVPRSALFVPMIVGGEVRGNVSLQNVDRDGAFTESDVRLLSTLTNSMSVALENARLFDETTRLLAETEQRNAEFAVINGVQEGLVAQLDMQAIYNLVGDRVRDLFDAQVVVIRTYDREAGLEHFRYTIEKGQRLEVPTQPIDDFARHLIETRAPVLINERFEDYIRPYSSEASLEGEVPRSALFVPMIVGDEVRGNVSLQNVDREHAFSDADVRLLSTLTNSMSVALENARLFDETTRLLAETEQRNAELAVINGVQEGLVAELDMQAIYDLVGDRLRELFDAQVVVIRTYDRDEGREHYRYVIEKNERLYVKPMPIDGFGRHLIETHEPVLINRDYAGYVKQFSGRLVVEGEFPKSALFVPMVVGGEVRGNVSLQNVDREEAFSEADMRLLSTLTNSMSVALESARLFAETRQQAVELDTVNRISRALVAQLDFDALVHLVGERMRETFQADLAYVALVDREEGVIRFPYVYGEELSPIAIGEGLTSRILQSSEPLLINHDVSGLTEQLGIERVGKRAASYLGVPIPAGDKPLGVISVQTTEQENRFDEDDLRLLSTIAANVGVALQNADAYRRLSEALAELKRTQEQLVQQEKLASLGALTAGIAHEIKNPLNFVTNFADLNDELAEELAEDLAEYPDARSAVEDVLADLQQNSRLIKQHGQRADAIVRSMMAHARGGRSEREAVQLNRLIEEYVDLAYHGQRARVPDFNAEIVRDLDTEVKPVEVVPQEIGRVLINLLSNAFEAVHEHAVETRSRGGGAGEEGYAPRVEISTRWLGSAVEVQVRDNGPGIPEAVRARIFEPFFTTKQAGKGTGLGLSMSYDIVTQGHGGSLEVASAAGEGTTFTMRLPAARGATDGRRVEDSDQPADPGS